MHEPQLSAFNCFPHDIQEYHLLFSFEQRMNLKLSFLIKTSQKMQIVVHFRYPRVVKWQVCVFHVLIPNFLWFCISLHLPVSLSVYLSVCHLNFLSKGKMREILLDAQELVARWQQADPTKKKTRADRQTLLNESWAQSHTEIFNFFLQSTFAVPDDAMCERCLMRLLWLKCHGCSASQHFCNGCDNIIHGYLPFHDRDAIVSRHYVPIPATTSSNSKGEWWIVGE